MIPISYLGRIGRRKAYVLMGRFQHDSRLSHLGEFGVEHLLHQRQFVRVFLSSGAVTAAVRGSSPSDGWGSSSLTHDARSSPESSNR